MTFIFEKIIHQVIFLDLKVISVDFEKTARTKQKKSLMMILLPNIYYCNPNHLLGSGFWKKGSYVEAAVVQAQILCPFIVPGLLISILCLLPWKSWYLPAEPALEQGSFPLCDCCIIVWVQR